MKPVFFVALSMILLCSFSEKEHTGIKPANKVLKDSSVRKEWYKKNVVVLNPNPSYGGTINVSTNIEDSVHFYVFDLEGTLMYQATLSKKEKKSINNLKKGTYMYDVFQNDESIEEGKIFVK
ncbi:MAG TPA: T9SS type A sorting domain-containing protein [Flavisolibacter sp.]|nr:T9SS type A sorting domain-containing protein [Flavisolibacter sp.]